MPAPKDPEKVALWKLHISERAKGHPGCWAGKRLSPETRKKMSVKKSPETRKKMSEAKKGVKRSPEACRAVSAGHIELKLSPETRKKISDTMKGRPLSPEHRNKLSKPHKGYRRRMTKDGKPAIPLVQLAGTTEFVDICRRYGKRSK